eukprot:gene14317-21958_t
MEPTACQSIAVTTVSAVSMQHCEEDLMARGKVLTGLRSRELAGNARKKAGKRRGNSRPSALCGFGGERSADRWRRWRAKAKVTWVLRWVLACLFAASFVVFLCVVRQHTGALGAALQSMASTGRRAHPASYHTRVDPAPDAGPSAALSAAFWDYAGGAPRLITHRTAPAFTRDPASRDERAARRVRAQLAEFSAFAPALHEYHVLPPAAGTAYTCLVHAAVFEDRPRDLVLFGVCFDEADGVVVASVARPVDVAAEVGPPAFAGIRELRVVSDVQSQPGGSDPPEPRIPGESTNHTVSVSVTVRTAAGGGALLATFSVAAAPPALELAALKLSFRAETARNDSFGARASPPSDSPDGGAPPLRDSAVLLEVQEHDGPPHGFRLIVAGTNGESWHADIEAGGGPWSVVDRHVSVGPRGLRVAAAFAANPPAAAAPEPPRDLLLVDLSSAGAARTLAVAHLQLVPAGRRPGGSEPGLGAVAYLEEADEHVFVEAAACQPGVGSSTIAAHSFVTGVSSDAYGIPHCVTRVKADPSAPARVLLTAPAAPSLLLPYRVQGIRWSTPTVPGWCPR